MYMQLVMQVLGRLMARFLTVYTLIKEHLLQLVNSLRVRFTLIYQSVATISNPLAQIKQSINRLVANLITQVQLIKAGLIHVLHKVGDLGQQLLTIAHQILQRVKALLQRGR
jgi:methyl-accepting chemotaxis protein